VAGGPEIKIVILMELWGSRSYIVSEVYISLLSSLLGIFSLQIQYNKASLQQLPGYNFISWVTASLILFITEKPQGFKVAYSENTKFCWGILIPGY